MATCKDCIHYDACLYVEIATNKEEDYYTEFGCEYFKNKADFVEVVRCEDCVYCITADCKNFYCSATTNPNHVDLDHFCSYGERKS